MVFRQFRYILKVAELGSISKAAQKLYVSQPSLSQLIASVEKKIGAPIFDRSSSPLRPTDIGQLYLKAAQQILDIDADFQQKADDTLNLKRGHIILGTTPFRSAYLLAPFLPQFQQKYPQIQITLVESTTRHLEEVALRGEVDLIITLRPIDEKHFSAQKLFAEELILALPPMHPLAKQLHLPTNTQKELPEISLTALRETPFIQMHTEQKLHNGLIFLCSEAGFTPNIVMTTSSMETAQALAGAGLGATMLPTTLMHNFQPQPAPCYAALTTHPQREVMLAWRNKRYLSHAARIFIQELTNFCR